MTEINTIMKNYLNTDQKEKKEHPKYNCDKYK